MNTLRKIIRSVIIEELSKNQQSIEDIQLKDWRSAFGAYGNPKGTRPDVQDGVLLDKYPNETKLRRDIKRIWNENADKDFFQNEVVCVHWLNFIVGHSSSKRTFLASMKRILYGDPALPPGTISKNEFSTLGYVKPSANYQGDGIVGIKIDPERSYVSFAAVVDSWTEFNFGTPKRTREYYKNSGLPKRPARNIDPSAVIFDKQDFIESGADELKECVVDNWTWDTIVVDKSYKQNVQVENLVDWIENEWNISYPNHIINIEYF